MIRAALIAVALTACAAVPDITYVDIDAGANTCPGSRPAYADRCCGSIACKGTNCLAACSDCEASCKGPDLCCPNQQARAVCRPQLQCP